MSVVCFAWIALAEKAVKRLFCFRLLKKGRMQVEPCEIPLAGAPEILRSEAYLVVRRNDEG
jgi:hypothetical protein